MNPYAISFSLNQNHSILIDLQDSITLLGWDDVEPILFVRENDNNIMLTNGPTYFNVRDMRDFLLKALNNELQIDTSIISDLGLIFNKYYHKASNSTIKQLKQQDALIVEPYRLWEAYDNEIIYVTWLYNDHNKNIIFEITPAYPYFYCDKKKEPHYISYKEWIKLYKPYFRSIVPRNIAQFWLEQAEFIVNAIDNNIIRWEKE